ncbi:MAG: hypothetical protein ACKVOY_10385, partial [Burkholderiaceae bacterium]
YGKDWRSEFLEVSMTVDNIKHCGIAYEPEVTLVPWEEVDRLSPMFAGPLFTSITYEWPTDSNDKYAVPVFKIPLAKLSRLSGESFGDGILQCWNLVDDYVLREIPKDEFRINNLIPSPLLEEETMVQGFLFRDVSIIEGYGQPFFSCAYTDISITDKAPEEVNEIVFYLNMLECDARHTQFFGTFDLMQYDHDLIGEKLLISVTDGFNGVSGFGLGSAQIFYTKNTNGKFDYFLEWSC